MKPTPQNLLLGPSLRRMAHTNLLRRPLPNLRLSLLEGCARKRLGELEAETNSVAKQLVFGRSGRN